MKGEITKPEQQDLNEANWFGSGATAIGLIGKVRRTDLEKFFNGFRTLKG
jgi:hypothetical protein